MSDASERYVRRREMAALLGISLATLDRRVGAGMPSYLWGARIRVFLPSEAVAWSKAHHGEPVATVIALEDRRARVQ